MSINTRTIGNTGVSLTELSLGCSAIANLYAAVSGQAAQDLLDFAWDSGIRYFDTAPHYGRGRSEQRLGTFLSTRLRSDYVLSTKVGRVLTPGTQQVEADGFVDPLPNDVHYDYSAAGFEASLASSRQRLGVERVDIVYVHDIGVLTHGADNEQHQRGLLERGLPYLQHLKATGVISA